MTAVAGERGAATESESVTAHEVIDRAVVSAVFQPIVDLETGEVAGFGVRGAALGDDDPLRGEGNVVVVGPHYAAALLAREVAGAAGRDVMATASATRCSRTTATWCSPPPAR